MADLYRKRPVQVEAEQWFPGKEIAGVCLVPSHDCPLRDSDGLPSYRPHIHTLEGPMLVSPGDWIITGVKGEKYPCKPDIFEMTYEKIWDEETNNGNGWAVSRSRCISCGHEQVNVFPADVDPEHLQCNKCKSMRCEVLPPVGEGQDG